MDQLFYKPNILRRARRVVIKVGSSTLSDSSGIKRDSVASIVDNLAALYTSGKEVVLVTSGAVAAGMSRLGFSGRPKTIPVKQAAAAVGQIALMALYEGEFSTHGVRVGQVLLTHDDLASRKRYLNAKHTMRMLLEAGAIPIVNENDTVAVEEIQLGDNDNLSAQVAVLIEADLLVILSDIAGLFNKDPRLHSDAVLLSLVAKFDESLLASGGAAGPLGRGGMVSKLQAAYKAALSGIPTILADGRKGDTIARVFESHTDIGTLFLPVADRLGSRKHWIAYTLKPAGVLVIDAGASAAIKEQGRSLLSPGIQDVRGMFDDGECVICLDEAGNAFAKGLVNYNSDALKRIKGARTSQIEQILGYKVSDEVIHRDDLALL